MHRWPEILWRDVKHALRSLRSSQRFALWVIGSLAIGMAVTIAAFAFVLAMLLGPIPGLSDQHRLVRIAVLRNCGAPDCWKPISSPAELLALREGLTQLQGLAGYTQRQLAVTLPEARSMRGGLASANYFDVLGVGPALGRLFTPVDEASGAAVAVLAYGTWTREFAADPAVIGRAIRVGDRFVQVVGVAPEFFGGIDLRPARGEQGRGPEIWLPLWLAQGVLPTTDRGEAELEQSFVGRMREGTEVEAVRAQAEVLARRLASEQGDARPGIASVRRVWMNNPENWGLGLLLIMPIPVLVLLLGCVNAAHLLSARASHRRREIAVRLALGAGRAAIVRGLLVESGALVVFATIAATLLASWSLRLADTPLHFPIRFNTLVVVFTVVAAAVTTLACGLVPALRFSAQPLSALGVATPRGDTNPRQSRFRHGIVTAQVALSIALLATGWQLVSTVRSQAVSGGTPPDRLLIARFNLQSVGVAPAEAERLYRGLAAEASRLPGVEAIGVARHTSVWGFGRGAQGSLLVWRPTDAANQGRLTIGGYAGGDLFRAIGLRTLEGRVFTEADRSARSHVAVVNQTFAQRLTGRAVDSVIRVAPRGRDFGSSIEVRIVGVVEPTLEPKLTQGDPPAPKVYLPSPIEPEFALALYLRTRGPAMDVAQPLSRLVSQVAPRVPITELGSLDDFNERSFAPQLWLARAAALLGGIGLVLASMGVYGVSSYVVALRSRELAIRMVVGANPRMILGMVLGESLRIALTGLLAGGAVALVVSRVIQAEYHGIAGIDAVAFGGAAVLFLFLMSVASLAPALRAARVDPAQTLSEI